MSRLANVSTKLSPEQVILRSERLVLRPLALADSPIVERLAGDRDVASTTRLIPHPYPPGMAEQWLATLPDLYQRAEAINWGITLDNGPILGTIRLVLNAADNHAEMGYWVGKPFWNNGYCTEAARAVVTYGFDVLSLERIFANYMARNPASGRVLAKLGMQQEGYLHRHRRKFGRYEDLIVCGITKAEWQQLKRARSARATAKHDGQPIAGPASEVPREPELNVSSDSPRR
jgi:RimJ/RimL family protein N-acetyltransferase